MIAPLRRVSTQIFALVDVDWASAFYILRAILRTKSCKLDPESLDLIYVSVPSCLNSVGHAHNLRWSMQFGIAKHQGWKIALP